MNKFSFVGLRIALIYLLIGVTLGTIGLIEKALGVRYGFGEVVAIHRSLLLYGWTLHLIIGVAYWILPTFGARVNVGREGFARASLVLLNIGVIVTSLAVFVKSAAILELVGYIFILLGSGSFALHAWPRIKEFGAKAK